MHGLPCPSYNEMLANEARLRRQVHMLKADARYVEYDLEELNHKIQYVSASLVETKMNLDLQLREERSNNKILDTAQKRINESQDSCRDTQRTLEENKAALRLYCQQFAFAPEMVSACAELLSCKDS